MLVLMEDDQGLMEDDLGLMEDDLGLMEDDLGLMEIHSKHLGNTGKHPGKSRKLLIMSASFCTDPVLFTIKCAFLVKNTKGTLEDHTRSCNIFFSKPSQG